MPTPPPLGQSFLHVEGQQPLIQADPIPSQFPHPPTNYAVLHFQLTCCPRLFSYLAEPPFHDPPRFLPKSETFQTRKPAILRGWLQTLILSTIDPGPIPQCLLYYGRVTPPYGPPSPKRPLCSLCPPSSLPPKNPRADHIVCPPQIDLEGYPHTNVNKFFSFELGPLITDGRIGTVILSFKSSILFYRTQSYNSCVTLPPRPPNTTSLAVSIPW